MIALELSPRGLLRDFGLGVGAISRGRFEGRVQEPACGNLMIEAASGLSPALIERASEMSRSDALSDQHHVGSPALTTD